MISIPDQFPTQSPFFLWILFTAVSLFCSIVIRLSTRDISWWLHVMEQRSQILNDLQSSGMSLSERVSHIGRASGLVYVWRVCGAASKIKTNLSRSIQERNGVFKGVNTTGRLH